MTNQAVFDAALRLIGEVPGAADLDDYTARGPYLVCAACRALAALDRLCRSAQALGEQSLPDGGEYALADAFPLCDDLLPAAAAHIASALLFDENPTLSDRCYARFTEAAQGLLRSLPAVVEEIVEKY